MSDSRPMFTARHYEQIAQTISTIAHPAVRQDVMAKFSHMLILDNENFQPQLFEDACFPSDGGGINRICPDCGEIGYGVFKSHNSCNAEIKI